MRYGRTAPFRLSELFGQLSQEFQLLAEQRNIRFKAKSRDVIVDTDPKLLRRVLQNFSPTHFVMPVITIASSLLLELLEEILESRSGTRELEYTQMTYLLFLMSLNDYLKAFKPNRKV